MANTYKALSTVTTTGSAGNIVFSNIPQTYTDLKLVMSVRGTASGTLGLQGYFNSYGTTINSRALEGNGSSAASYSGSFGVWSYITMNDAGTTANTFSNIEMYIPNYTNTSTNKSFFVDGVTENNATTAYQDLLAGLNQSTSAITSITIGPSSGNFAANSTFTLYGVFNADVSSAPATPTIGTATAGDTSASITFTGVSNAASYTMTSTPSSITGTGTTSPITVSGLTNGTAYTFKVKSNNPFGSSAESAASNSITPTAAAYDSIASTVVGAGGASEITFSGIPATYQHLQLRWFAPSSQTTATSWCLYVGNNGIATSGYTYHTVYGYGNTGSGATTRPNESQIEVHYVPAGSTTPFAGIIDILDYANTNKNKSVRSISGHVNTSSGTGSQNWIVGGAWLSNSAITDVRFQFGTGGNTMPQYTRVALYGIKG